MALMEVDFFSNVLGMSCQSTVILPQANQGIGIKGLRKDGKYPVLWLLHGASDDHTTWVRRTSIERYVASLGIAVVMPEVHLSMYTNMAHGPRYMDYVADELPEILREFFPISDKREENYIAGQSMGGYGCMKIGLSRPDNYSAIGCFSSGNLIHMGTGKRPNFGRDRVTRNITIYGVEDTESLVGTEHDIFNLANKCIENKKILPRIYQVCGTEDFLLEQSRQTSEWFNAKKEFDYTYLEALGEHSWDFWDVWIQDFLKWMV